MPVPGPLYPSLSLFRPIDWESWSRPGICPWTASFALPPDSSPWMRRPTTPSSGTTRGQNSPGPCRLPAEGMMGRYFLTCREGLRAGSPLPGGEEEVYLLPAPGFLWGSPAFSLDQS